jgi:hypothetical protein
MWGDSLKAPKGSGVLDLGGLSRSCPKSW